MPVYCASEVTRQWWFISNCWVTAITTLSIRNRGRILIAIKKGGVFQRNQMVINQTYSCPFVFAALQTEALSVRSYNHLQISTALSAPIIKSFFIPTDVRISFHPYKVGDVRPIAFCRGSASAVLSWYWFLCRLCIPFLELNFCDWLLDILCFSAFLNCWASLVF